MDPAKTGLRASGTVFLVNIALAVGKIAAGIAGNSYALVADGIESTADSATAMIVWVGLRISERPPDNTHPYGHGKAESIAALIVSLFVLGAAGLIAFQSIAGVASPQNAPAPYTLIVLVAVVVIKETMFRKVHHIGDRIHSGALKSDAWHHRSDAITSLAAFVGISIAVIGGEGYEAADDWAALAACAVIAFNGVRLVLAAINDIMDSAAPGETQNAVRKVAKETQGVVNVEKCRVRKSGLGVLLDIHVVVDGDITVRKGHDIAHQVQNRLHKAMPEIRDVVVHIEPHDL